ncbi:tRNA modification GTPase MnmE [Qipengyuania nanhaisediminis]
MLTLAGRDFVPRQASLARLRDPQGAVLDHALVLWFPGPRSATGEDCAELHCHGGRAVLDAVQRSLSEIEGLRPAEEGEFTRRAFANGRIDLAEAEGLADLLEAETEWQRASAIASAGGRLSSLIEGWRDASLRAAAEIEAALDFSDEDDVAQMPARFAEELDDLCAEIGELLDAPRSEKIKEGFRVVLAGPPNSGKSTLFNALTDSEAAITSPIAGTTRDVIERSVAIAGIPFSLVDTAGLREDGNEPIEAIGIARARAELSRADCILWLGPEGEGPSGAWEISTKSDDANAMQKAQADHVVSAVTGEGIGALKAALVERARAVLPKPGEAALNARQHARLAEAHAALRAAGQQRDLLLIGEELRQARLAFDRLIGRATTEDMLDALFSRFCIGK